MFYSVIIPFRQREEHLAMLLPRLNFYLNGAEIIVVEQADELPFNRGKLLNIGALNSNRKYYIMHDVDHLPTKYTIYESQGLITQLARNDIQKRDFLGGVTMYLAETFNNAGGYHNDYFHRAEDNEMFFNLQRLNYHITERHQPFEIVPHKRPGIEFDKVLWQKAQQKRILQNQLLYCRYDKLADTHCIHLHGKTKISYRKITVKL